MPQTKGPLPENRKAPPERVLFAMEQLRNHSSMSVRRAIMEHFKIKDSAAKRAIRMARLVMDEEATEKAPHARTTIINRLEKITDLAIENKDYSAAVRAQRELVAIYGLKAPEEFKLTLDAETEAGIKSMTDAELAIIAKLDGGGKPTEH